MFNELNDNQKTRFTFFATVEENSGIESRLLD